MGSKYTLQKKKNYVYTWKLRHDYPVNAECGSRGSSVSVFLFHGHTGLRSFIKIITTIMSKKWQNMNGVLILNVFKCTRVVNKVLCKDGNSGCSILSPIGVYCCLETFSTFATSVWVYPGLCYDIHLVTILVFCIVRVYREEMLLKICVFL